MKSHDLETKVFLGAVELDIRYTAYPSEDEHGSFIWEVDIKEIWLNNERQDLKEFEEDEIDEIIEQINPYKDLEP